MDSQNDMKVFFKVTICRYKRLGNIINTEKKRQSLLDLRTCLNQRHNCFRGNSIFILFIL